MEEIQKEAFAACARFDEELQAYLEGQSRPFIISHSRDCPSCGALLADLEAVRQAAQALPLEEPPRTVWANVHAKLEAEGAFSVPACSQFGAELSAYLEGEPRSFMVTHAQECAPCGALLADLQMIQQAARELPMEEPSAAAWANLRTRLQAEGLLASAACYQFNEELEAFLEGEARPLVVAHARECGPCDAVLADLQAVRQAAKDLPLEEPSRVVWANVRARLEAEGAFNTRSSGWRQILEWRLYPHAVPVGVLAALIFLGSALTLPTTSLQQGNGADAVADSQTTIQTASLLPAGDDGALAHVVSDLESSFRANEASMAPDLKATYEKSLVSLDGSIRECLDSLRHEPRNTLAHDYLLTAYTRKAEVLSSALEFEGR
jgi:predicted nucleic acid-binding protein